MANLKNFEALEDFMQSLGSEADGVMKVATKEAADFCVKILKEKSRALFGNGPYAKGWRYQKTAFGYTVYNKQYQLVHLLEKGHAIVDVNGASHGTAPARPHVGPAEKETADFFTKTIEEGLTNL